ncbi:acylphosphatase-2 isoform X3 [Chrysemys picta bellii]|uniref:acylphosphatase-2 isoform X3 n=1 Tax=Chrysemys picta bellii TaxID=8478 RepID=UPI001C680973|nr:acylphosphatase-2 isoform X3 [Chrysemys picta bellii]XP_042717121.1 acylphosphatase-2 isoform X3 [Chrysemys picta bellii]XP_042717122.1 acylphosphatase-2 isoform X3 [Chrysemys picta bellii]
MKCLAGCRGLKPEALEVFFRCIAKKLRLGIENPSKGYIQRSRITSVCFRMYTEDEARKMGVVGWVKNTRQGTVTGQVQGPEDKVNAMWSTNDYSLLLLSIIGVTRFTVVSADYAAVLEVQSSNPDDDDALGVDELQLHIIEFAYLTHSLAFHMVFLKDMTEET